MRRSVEDGTWVALIKRGRKFGVIVDWASGKMVKGKKGEGNVSAKPRVLRPLNFAP